MCQRFFALFVAFFVSMTAYAAFPDAHGDLDGDGVPDILSRSTQSGRLFWTRMSGSGVPSALLEILPTLGVEWHLSAVGDLTGDGKADLVWRNTQTNQVALWQMDGPRPAQGYYLRAPSAMWRLVGAGDFNGDGRADLVWRNRESRNIELWLMNGPNILGTSVIAVLPHLGWQAAAFADFDGDGKYDMLWHNRHVATDRYALWLMDGLTIKAASALGFTHYWYPEAVGDFNGDGRADILTVESETATVRMMNGMSIVSTHTQPFDRIWAGVALGDYNSDGRDDIVWQKAGHGANWSDFKLVVWLMNGPTWGSATSWFNPVTDLNTPIVAPYLPWPRNIDGQ